ncbi:MAG: hypothetical protein AB7V39_19230, partial [Nitrospiraceae bacterium]
MSLASVHQTQSKARGHALPRCIHQVLCGFLFLSFITACKSYSTIETPITDGYHSKLPSPYTRAVVWGTRPDTVQSVSTWL